MLVELPYPPSVNHYWRNVGGKVLISRKGRAYRNNVAARLLLARVQRLDGRLALSIDLYPPDRRKRDLDNPLKSLLDALAFGKAYRDDSQIDQLAVRRREVVPGGCAIVNLFELEESPCPP